MFMIIGVIIGALTLFSWILVKVTGPFCSLTGPLCSIATQIDSNSFILYPLAAFLVGWGATGRWYFGIIAALVTGIIVNLILPL